MDTTEDTDLSTLDKEGICTEKDQRFQQFDENFLKLEHLPQKRILDVEARSHIEAQRNVTRGISMSQTLLTKFKISSLSTNHPLLLTWKKMMKSTEGLYRESLCRNTAIDHGEVVDKFASIIRKKKRSDFLVLLY